MLMKPMKVKIGKQNYEYECGDGCCSEWGITWYVNGEVVHSSPCEDNGLLAVLEKLGIEAEIVILDKDGEEVCSL